MLSRKGDGKLIKRKKRKDIQALRSRTRRKSSLGIRSVRKSPFSVRNLFGKVSLCCLWKRNKRAGKKSQSYDRSGLCPSTLFLWNGDNDTFYGCIQNSDGTLEQTVSECKGSRNVCVCGGRRRSRRNYAS